MSGSIIAFFSSDAREKYKGDIFRVLALPQKYGIHFRYKRGWIHPTVLSKLDSLIGREGVIFYTKGNNTSLAKAKRKIVNYSIRNIIIKDIYVDNKIDLVNFYLELNDFRDCDPHENTSKELLPPYGFVSEINVMEGKNHAWNERVSAIEDSFKGILFYNLNSVRNDDNELQPKYSKSKREWYYELQDESEYQIQASFYDTSNGENGLTVENSNNMVLLDIPSGHKVSAEYDTTVFDLYTQSLSKPQSRSFSRLTIKSGEDTKNQTQQIDLSVQIYWNAIRTASKIFRFGLLSVLAAIGVLGLSIAFKDLTTVTYSIMNWVIALLSLIFIGISASYLFMWFNKK